MRAKPFIKAVSVMLSVLMLVGSAQVGLTAFAAEVGKTRAADGQTEKTVSQAVKLEGQVNGGQGAEVGARSDGEVSSSVDYQYDPDTCTITITGEGDMTDYTYSDYSKRRLPWDRLYNEIKKVVIGKDITSVGSYSFYKFEAIEEVEIQGNVTKIGSCAFEGCKSLKSVNLPDSLTELGEDAFCDCILLEAVSIPAGVTKMGRAFYGCYGLKSINISQGVTVIGGSSFYGCKSVETVEIPDSVTEIKNGAFSDCAALKSIEIPDSVTTVESYAFYGCKSLKTVKLSKNTTKYGSRTFYDCSALEEITIPNGVTEIGDYVFANTSLTSINLPDGLQTLGGYAFSKTGIKTLDIPNSVTNISDNAFSGLTDLTIRADTGSIAKLQADKNGIDFVSTGVINHEGECGENVTYFIDSAKGVMTIRGTGAIADYEYDKQNYVTNIPWYIYRNYVKKLVLEDGVTKIGNYAFSYHEALEEVTFPKSLKSIGDNAFGSCYSLVEITIPDSITYMGKRTFAGCKKLETANILANITEFSEKMLASCTSLKRLEVPDSVTFISKSLFDYSTVPNLTIYAKTGSYAKLFAEKNRIPFISTGVLNHEGKAGDNITYFLDVISGVITFSGSGKTDHYRQTYDKDDNKIFTAPWGAYSDYIKKAVFEDGITEIGWCLMCCHKNLTEVSLPDSVTSISGYAFSTCPSLESFTIPDSVTDLGEYAFKDTAIKKIKIPDSVTSIGANMLPNNAVIQAKIGSYAKLYADKCNNIAFESTGVLNHEGMAGENVSYFIDSKRCVIYLTGTGDTDNYLTYGNYNRKFQPWDLYKDYIKEVVVEEGVTSVGSCIFRECKTLKKVTLADSVATIGSRAFEYCYSLESVVIPENAVINDGAFRGNKAMTAAVIPESVTSIANSAFGGCTNLTIFGMPNSVAFENAQQNSIKFSPITGVGSGIAVCETGSDYFNMTLKLTSEDGESVYSRIIDKNSVNTVYGIDTEKTYTAEIYANNGLVFCKKTGIDFNGETLINVSFENVKKPLNVGVKLLDDRGEKVDDYEVRWTGSDGKKISENKSISKRIDGETLGCEITLGDSLANVYKTPEKAEITLSEASDNILEIKLKKLPEFTLSGTVTDSEDSELSGVKITAVQQGADNRSVVTNAETDENGGYSLKLKSGDYQLTASKKGYYDKKLSGSISEEKAENITLGKLAGAKVTCVILSSLLEGSLSTAAASDDFEFTVHNETSDKELKDFTFQNDNFWFNGGDVSQGDKLRFTAKDKTGVFADCTEEATYSEGAFVKFKVTEKGVISCVMKNSQNESNVMAVFDGSGKYVETVRFNRLKASSSHLTAGSYKAVLMGDCEAAFSPSSISDLEEFGLSEGEDYILNEAVVKDGEKTEISGAEIPSVNLDKLGYLEPKGTSVSVNRYNVPIGQYCTIRAEYIEKNEYTAYTENEQMIFELPENLKVSENGVTVNGVSFTDYEVRNNILTVNLSAKNAIVRVCLTNALPAESVTVSAKLRFDMNGIRHSQPLGSASVKLGELDFYVAEKTAQTNIYANGNAFPDATVKVYDNETLVAEGKANKVGKFSVPFELYKPFTKTKHNIFLEITKTDGTVLRSQTKTVSYDKSIIHPLRVTMCGILGHSYDEIVLDYINSPVDTVNYMLYVNDTTITYKVEFNRYDPTLEDVVVYSTDSRGNTIEIPTVYDEESKAFVGSYDYDSYNIPAELSVGFKDNCEDTGLDMLAATNEIVSDDYWAKSVNEFARLNNISPIKIWKNDDGDYSLGMVTDLEKFFITLTDSSKGEISGYESSYYFDNRLIATDQCFIEQKSSPLEAQNQLKKEGFVESKDAGDTFEQCGVNVYEKNIIDQTIENANVLNDGTVIKNKIDVKKNTDASSESQSTNTSQTNPHSDETNDSYFTYEKLKKYANIPKDLFDIYGWQLINIIHSGPVGLGIAVDYLTDGKYTIKAYEYLTGDSSRDQLARYFAAVERIEECYKAQGLDPEEIDKLMDQATDNMGILLTLSIVNNTTNVLLNAFLSSKGVMGAINGASYVYSNVVGSKESPELGYETGIELTSFWGAVDTLGNMSLPWFNVLRQALTSASLRDEINRAPVNWDNVKNASAGTFATLSTAWLSHSATEKAEVALKHLENFSHKCVLPPKDKSADIKLSGSLDPSGYICEAVESNRVEGVTCTVFYSPNADGSNAVEWNAAEFDQKNPLISDAMGYYEWYVPEGWWQVRYEKDGYTTAYSEWLPVPPPQTEVNVAMTSLDAPKIKSVYVYQNEIDVEFTQYMNVYTVSGKTLTVTLGGEKVSGKLVPVNSENGFENPALSYATKFRFVSDSSFSLDDKVCVSIKGAANYADNTIADYSGEFDVVPKPEKITADEAFSLKWKDTAEITIKAEPKEACANKKITVTSNSPAIAEVLTPTVTTDENGCATVQIKGVLPGAAELEYRLENSDCSGSTAITVEMPVQKVKSVAASVTSGSKLAKGSKVTLFCPTEGAEIYYTTDLSCPCNLTGDSRIKYTGPIEITEYTTIIAYAVKDGMEDSKTTLFIYDVQDKLPTVTASVASGSTVEKGTKISLSCAEEDAVIYYTTDGSCPCNPNNQSRIKYTAPITIDGDATVIAYAVKDGMADSDKALFTYTVSSSVKGDTNGDGKFNISDVTYLQKHLAKLIEVDEATAKNWDFNKNGKVDIADATFMQKVLAKSASF